MQSVYIGVPSRGDVRIAVVRSLNKLHDAGARVCDYQSGHLTAVEGRNKLRRNFLATDCEVLLMIDYDVEPVHGVMEMAMRGLDICAVPVMIQHPDVNVPFFNVYQSAGADGWTPSPEQFRRGQLSGAVECDAMGFGAVAISRQVIEALPPFALEDDEQGIPIRSEDLPYCAKAKAKGFRVWADYSAQADHLTVTNLRDLQERNARAFEKMQRLRQAQAATPLPMPSKILRVD